MKRRTMAVVRGSEPRMAEIYFYAHFKKLKIKFLGDKSTGWVVDDAIPKNIDVIDLPLRPVWGIDPVTQIINPMHNHRAWKHLSDLEEYLDDVEVINVSDLFYFYSGQCARLAKRLNKKLVAIVWENVPYHLSTYLPPYSFNVRAMLANTDLFIARSKKSKKYLLSIGADEEKVRVIYKGIDQAAFSMNSRRMREKVRILYVGQLVKSKGVVELVEAFERLVKEYDNLELWLLGRSSGEPLESYLEKKAKRLPIKLKAQVDYDKLPNIYHQADVYCHMSKDWKYLGLIRGGNDWFPYAVLEAMASGLPVVATKVGGIPEQLGSKNGNIYVKQGDIDSVYMGLKMMIVNSKLRRRVGEKNRKRVEKMFDIRTQARKTEEVIVEII